MSPSFASPSFGTLGPGYELLPRTFVWVGWRCCIDDVEGVQSIERYGGLVEGGHVLFL